MNDAEARATDCEGTRIVTDRLVGGRGLRTFRELMADVCTPSLAPGAQEFEATSRICHVGAAVITEMRSCPLRYLRTTAHVSRSGYDHFQINLTVVGSAYQRSGRKVQTFGEGDIGIVDTLRATNVEVRTPADRSQNLAIFIPRAVFTTLISSAGAHGTLLRGNSSRGRVLGEMMLSLAREAERLGSAQIGTRIAGLLGLVAETMGDATQQTPATRQAMRMALLASAKRHIERHLDSPNLCADALAGRFGWSRATLYRLFEVDGGLTRYIQGRRLQRAYAELASPAHSRRRILDIALDSHFASDATFNRAFRRAYGVPPGEIRERSRLLRARGHARAAPGERGSQAVHWIQQLKVPPSDAERHQSAKAP